MRPFATMMVTLDGVDQGPGGPGGPGGPDEDRRNGFDRGGWTAAYAETTTTSTGVLIQTYRPTGRATFADVAE